MRRIENNNGGEVPRPPDDVDTRMEISELMTLAKEADIERRKNEINRRLEQIEEEKNALQQEMSGLVENVNKTPVDNKEVLIKNDSQVEVTVQHEASAIEGELLKNETKQEKKPEADNGVTIEGEFTEDNIDAKKTNNNETGRWAVDPRSPTISEDGASDGIYEKEVDPNTNIEETNISDMVPSESYRVNADAVPERDGNIENKTDEEVKTEENASENVEPTEKDRLQERLKDLQNRLNTIRANRGLSPEERNRQDEEIGAEYFEVQQKLKGIEKEGKENLAGQEFQELTSKHFEASRSKGERVMGWLKERLKGLLTFGIWEVQKAEKFRKGTKETAIEIENELAEHEGIAELNRMGRFSQEEIDGKYAEKIIRQEVGRLTVADALEEASTMREVFGAKKLEVPTAKEYEEMSNNLTQIKIEKNQKVEDKIVADSLEKLKNNPRLKKYVGYSGGGVLTEEKLAEVEKRIRNSVMYLRRGQANQDLVGYKKKLREVLDENWYKRYVAGGVELALWVGGAAAIHHFYFTGAEAIHGATNGTAEVIRAMKDMVWGETHRALVDLGISNPTDAQVLEAAKMVAQDSGVAVREWGITGDIIDTNMPGGYILKFGRVVANIAKIAAMGG